MSTYEVVSEIAGTVWQINAQVGDQIESGAEIMIIESMKMEIPVIAENSGTLKEIRVEKDTVISEGQVLAIIES